jgi:hypothetical protein
VRRIPQYSSTDEKSHAMIWSRLLSNEYLTPPMMTRMVVAGATIDEKIMPTW